MKFQIEWANAFKEWCEQKLLSQKHSDSLMKMACGYISSNIHAAIEEEDSKEESVLLNYVNAWMDLFVELNGNISMDSLKNEAIPTVKNLVDLKNK